MRVELASSFAAVSGPDARVLILGTLPGAASIAHGEYYAHPRNAFWHIMAEITGADPALPYDERLRCLVRTRVAVWDVCAHAIRPGSLDSSIDAGSIVPNDIGGFLRTRGQIQRICFNGGNAERLFRRLVLGRLDEAALAIPRLRLPSTSPAHAGMSFERKLDAWRAALAG
jgi:double-stranded uracil-DNA glycosylase